MSQSRITRRRLLGAMGAAGALAVLPACKRGGGGGAAGAAGAVKIGLVVPQSGVYATVGNEVKHGWELWLERHGGKLGNREVTTVVADEGENPQTGVPAVQKLLQSDQVDAIVGVISSAIALGAKDIVAEAKKLMIVANAGARRSTPPCAGTAERVARRSLPRSAASAAAEVLTADRRRLSAYIARSASALARSRSRSTTGA